MSVPQDGASIRGFIYLLNAAVCVTKRTHAAEAFPARGVACARQRVWLARVVHQACVLTAWGAGFNDKRCRRRCSGCGVCSSGCGRNRCGCGSRGGGGCSADNSWKRWGCCGSRSRRGNHRTAFRCARRDALAAREFVVPAAVPNQLTRLVAGTRAWWSAAARIVFVLAAAAVSKRGFGAVAKPVCSQARATQRCWVAWIADFARGQRWHGCDWCRCCSRTHLLSNGTRRAWCARCIQRMRMMASVRVSSRFVG